MTSAVAGGALMVAGPASADPVTFTGSLTSGTLTIKAGDADYERILAGMQGGIVMNTDDAGGAVSASTTFDPIITENFAGPFGLVLFLKAELAQTGPATGTYDYDTGAVTANSQQRLTVTVYNNDTPGAVVGDHSGQKPESQGSLSGDKCNVLVNLALTGTIQDDGTVLALAQRGFSIPQFADCALATDSLNKELAGPANNVELTYGGRIAAPTTTTTTTTVATTATTVAPSTSTTIEGTTTTTEAEATTTTVAESSTTTAMANITTAPPSNVGGNSAGNSGGSGGSYSPTTTGARSLPNTGSDVAGIVLFGGGLTLLGGLVLEGRRRVVARG